MFQIKGTLNYSVPCKPTRQTVRFSSISLLQSLHHVIPKFSQTQP